MKKLAGLVFMFVLCFIGIASADDSEVDMEVYCPSTAVAGGTPITAQVKFTNYGCTSVSVQRYMTIIAGNSGAHTLSNAGIWGPFPKSFANPIVIPAANCLYPNTPGVKSVNVTAGDAPAGMSGTMAMVVIEFLTPKGGSRFSGSCMVAIQ